MHYKTLIFPVFDYCDYIVNGMTQQDSETLQKLQNMCFTNILHTDYRTHSLQQRCSKWVNPMFLVKYKSISNQSVKFTTN